MTELPLTVDEKLDRIATDLAYLAERQRRLEELVTELQPVAKLAMGVATERLADMEAKGWFRFGRAAGRVAERAVGAYDEAALDAFADNVVRILDTVRAVTQPEVLDIVGQAADVVHERDALAPLRITGMVRAARDEEVQRGLAVMMELLRHLGRAADVIATQPPPARLARPERPAAPAAAPAAAAVGPRAPRRGLDPDRPRRTGVERGLSCATPKPPEPAATTLGGVGYTADGFLADPAQWSRALGESIAAAAGVEMTAAHWALVEFARKDWEETRVSPNIRRLSTGAGVNTRDIYTLFKKAPGKTVARIAGIPKPAGCI